MRVVTSRPVIVPARVETWCRAGGISPEERVERAKWWGNYVRNVCPRVDSVRNPGTGGGIYVPGEGRWGGGGEVTGDGTSWTSSGARR